MTLQEIFNKVVLHLRKQNSRSTISTQPETEIAVPKEWPDCAYRGDNGKMCAVGCLISDEAYDPAFEGYAAHNINVTKMLEKSGIEVTREVEDMLYDLQQVHDNAEPEDWETGFASIAEQFTLEVP